MKTSDLHIDCDICDQCYQNIQDIVSERDAERAEVARLRAAIGAHKRDYTEAPIWTYEVCAVRDDASKRLWAALAGGGNE